MRICALLLCVLSVTLIAIAGPVPDRETDIATTLSTLEHFKFEAQQRNDIAVLDTMLDSALMWVDEDGALSTKAAYLEGLRSASGNQRRIVPESISVKVFDGVAIVFGTYDERGLRAGHPYHQHCRFIDTWVFKSGRWVCIAATATSAIS